MKIQFAGLVFLLTLNLCGPAFTADYRAEPLAEGPPAAELSDGIAAQLSHGGVRVIRGTKTTYCDIWLCKRIVGKKGFEPDPEVLYPFQPGQLIGVARFSRKGGDFRDQEISQGVYTLRYAHQPVDGAHVGTSPTRDFLLLVKADQDMSADILNYETLTEQSAEAAESSHPCMLSLQRVAAVAKEHPMIRHDERTDWWIVGLAASVTDGDAVKKQQIDLVVSGAAAE